MVRLHVKLTHRNGERVRHAVFESMEIGISVTADEALSPIPRERVL